MTILQNLIFWMWIGVGVWWVVGSFSGILTRKERLSVATLWWALITFSGILNVLTADVAWERGWHATWAVVNANWVRVYYKRWKNTDDDDKWKKRRQSWVKNHLPKPVTKKIPQPI